MVFAALLVEFRGAGLMTCDIMHHDGDHGAHGPKAAPLKSRYEYRSV